MTLEEFLTHWKDYIKLMTEAANEIIGFVKNPTLDKYPNFSWEVSKYCAGIMMISRELSKNLSSFEEEEKIKAWEFFSFFSKGVKQSLSPIRELEGFQQLVKNTEENLSTCLGNFDMQSFQKQGARRT